MSAVIFVNVEVLFEDQPVNEAYFEASAEVPGVTTLFQSLPKTYTGSDGGITELPSSTVVLEITLPSLFTKRTVYSITGASVVVVVVSSEVTSVVVVVVSSEVTSVVVVVVSSEVASVVVVVVSSEVASVVVVVVSLIEEYESNESEEPLSE